MGREGREGRERGRLGEGGREGRDDCYTYYSNGTTILNFFNNHVLRNNVSRRSIVHRRLHAEQWYVIITFDVTWTAGITNKLPGAGVQTSYVHSRINNLLMGDYFHEKMKTLTTTKCTENLLVVYTGMYNNTEDYIVPKSWGNLSGVSKQNVGNIRSV